MTDGPTQTVILCGGRGTRLREYTESLPKPLVEIGGRPILWHIMRMYAAQGFRDFVLALGYLGEQIERDFKGLAEDWRVAFVPTGPDTQTGGRIARVRAHVSSPFFATYGDGLADVDLRSLLTFHRGHGRAATVTVVQPSLGFGLADVDAMGRVVRFVEKPRVNGWVNGGFFVFDERIFEYLGPDSVLEREPMERLAAAGQLMAFRHEGFWACMDTYKDHEELNALWMSGRAPWRA